jgi:hypothetical protein
MAESKESNLGTIAFVALLGFVVGRASVDDTDVHQQNVDTAASSLLSSGDATVVDIPKKAADTPKSRRFRAPEPEQEDDVYYQNCSAARAAGAAPVYAGDPGYARKLDRDGDGVGCE